MKTFTITLAAAFVLAAAPFVLAAEGDHCSDVPNVDYIEHPLEDGVYLWINPSSVQKIGEWVEANGNPGLQSQKCFDAAGTPISLPDEKTDVLA